LRWTAWHNVVQRARAEEFGIETSDALREIAGTIWLLVPLLGAGVVHGLVMKNDWLRALRRPIDGGRNWSGRPLFGANKTWRGIVAVSAGCSIVTGIQSDLLHALDAVRAIELFDYGAVNGWLLGALAGALAEFSELPNSFCKRRFGIEPGGTGGGWCGRVFFVWDQVDLLLGLWFAYALVVDVTLFRVVVSIVVLLAVHPVVTLLGYLAGMRLTAR